MEFDFISDNFKRPIRVDIVVENIRYSHEFFFHLLIRNRKIDRTIFLNKCFYHKFQYGLVFNKKIKLGFKEIVLFAKNISKFRWWHKICSIFNGFFSHLTIDRNVWQ